MSSKNISLNSLVTSNNLLQICLASTPHPYFVIIFCKNILSVLVLKEIIWDQKNFPNHGTGQIVTMFLLTSVTM